jgi:hypothetical protein
MDIGMGYVLLALLVAPMALLWLFILAIVTGLLHEPTAVQTVAQAYRQSWKSITST